LPERAIDELGPEEDLREWLVVRVNDEITVDLMTAACGVTFAEAKVERSTIDTWRRKLGYEVQAYISGSESPWRGEPLGQSTAIVRKA
jgi:hypothetical protein